LNYSSGAEIWRYETNGRIVVSSPAISDGVLYIGSLDHTVYALDTSDGTLIWAFVTGDMVVSTPTVINGTVYIGSQDDKVYALNSATGEPKWV
jgi:outer membrane protein assembly factor BamB